MTAFGCHLGHTCVAEGEGEEPRPKGGKARVASATGADPKVRCVAALQVDGATSIIAKAGEAGWHPDVQDELRAAHRGATVRLPDPSGPDPIALAVKRNYGPHLHLHVAGRVTIKINGQHETVEVIAAKEELWTGGGFGAWADTWLRLASYWFLDQPWSGLANAAALGWRVHNLEVASDFIGLSIELADTVNFKSPSTIMVINPAKCETVQVGSRGRGAISMSVHDKHEQIRKVHEVEPTDSIYGAHWCNNGWNRVRRIRRVELRADGHALKFKDTGTGQVFDLTNPAALLDRDALAHLWHEGTRRHRLDLPAQGIGKGKKAPTDPRWIAVQSVANVSGVGRSVHLRPAPTPRQPRGAADAAEALAQALDGIRAAGIVSEDVCAQLVQLVADEGGDDAFVDKLDAALSSLGLPTTGSYGVDPPPAPRIGD
jgi:hypothetical protein